MTAIHPATDDLDLAGVGLRRELLSEIARTCSHPTAAGQVHALLDLATWTPANRAAVDAMLQVQWLRDRACRYSTRSDHVGSRFAQFDSQLRQATRDADDAPKSAPAPACEVAHEPAPAVVLDFADAFATPITNTTSEIGPAEPGLSDQGACVAKKSQKENKQPKEPKQPQRRLKAKPVPGDKKWKSKDWRDWWGSLPDSVRAAHLDPKTGVTFAGVRALACLYAVAGSTFLVKGTPDRIVAITGYSERWLRDQLLRGDKPLARWATVDVVKYTPRDGDDDEPDYEDRPAQEHWEITLHKPRPKTDDAPGEEWIRVRAWWLLERRKKSKGGWRALPATASPTEGETGQTGESKAGRMVMSDDALRATLAVSKHARKTGIARTSAATLAIEWTRLTDASKGSKSSVRATKGKRADGKPAGPDPARRARDWIEAAVDAGTVSVTGNRRGGRSGTATRVAVTHPDKRPDTRPRVVESKTSGTIPAALPEHAGSLPDTDTAAA